MQDRNSTVFGVSADYREGQSVFSEYRVGNGISGRGAHAAIGLRNQWEIDEGVRLHTTFERVSPMDSVGSGDALAVTGGTGDHHQPLLEGHGPRVEYRATERQDHVLGTRGFRQTGQRRDSPSWPRASGARFWTAALSTSVPASGLAYRGADRNGLYALARYEHRTDDDPLAPEGPRDHKAHIFSTHLNLRPVESLTARAQWAAKFATDRGGGAGPSISRLNSCRGGPRSI